jgi:hypothetical protein
VDDGLGLQCNSQVALTLTVDKHVDVLADTRARLAETVAHSWPRLIEEIHKITQRGRVYFKVSRWWRVEQRYQRTR